MSTSKRRETLEEKQRRISVSFLDISEAHTTDGGAVANTDDLIAKGSDSVTPPPSTQMPAFIAVVFLVLGSSL